MDKDESCLENVKREYFVLQGKYGLPDFDTLNKDFQIEKVAETETEILLREVRRFVFDKISNYMRFLEGLLNPSGASMFVFSILKSLNSDDKKLAEKIYKKLMALEIDLMEIDITYDEEKEAEFIKKSFNEWSEIKQDWAKIISSIKKNWDNQIERNNGRGYFG